MAGVRELLVDEGDDGCPQRCGDTCSADRLQITLKGNDPGATVGADVRISSALAVIQAAVYADVVLIPIGALVFVREIVWGVLVEIGCHGRGLVQGPHPFTPFRRSAAVQKLPSIATSVSASRWGIYGLQRIVSPSKRGVRDVMFPSRKEEEVVGV